MSTGPLTQAIERNIRQGLSPTILKVVNESWKHAGHAAVENDTTNETHFHVTIVSEAFSGKVVQTPNANIIDLKALVL